MISPYRVGAERETRVHVFVRPLVVRFDGRIATAKNLAHGIFEACPELKVVELDEADFGRIVVRTHPTLGASAESRLLRAADEWGPCWVAFEYAGETRWRMKVWDVVDRVALFVALAAICAVAGALLKECS